METIRPMVSNLAMQQADSLPPGLQPLSEIPEMLDAIKLHLDVDGTEGTFELTLVGIDEDSAIRIESILNDSMVEARALGLAEMNRSLAETPQSDEMIAATQQYGERIAAMITQTLRPTRNGSEITIGLDSQVGVASLGVMVGLLLPAVQAARQAARRMNFSNNMKQVGLAMHNHHSAYKRLPDNAIRDEDGKPLLSWRVAVLPFIEEQELYEEFHLDESWDSEHNLPLSKRMPAVFSHPGLNLPEDQTVVHACVGETFAFKPLKKNKFRDFLDGLSNTIMVVEGNEASAVIWSKPQDITIDVADPLANLTGSPDGGFHVLLGDGAVRFLTDEVETDFFNDILTRAGNEVINQW